MQQYYQKITDLDSVMGRKRNSQASGPQARSAGLRPDFFFIQN